MIYLNMNNLLMIGAWLLFLAVIIWPRKSENFEENAAIKRKSLSKLIGITGGAALIAALVCQLGATQPNDYYGYNKFELKDIISNLRWRLEYSWVIAVGFTITIIIMAILAWLVHNEQRVEKDARREKVIDIGRIVLWIFATISFIGAGVANNIKTSQYQAMTEEKEVEGLQLALVGKLEEFAKKHITLRLIMTAEHLNPGVIHIHSAYNKLARYLPGNVEGMGRGNIKPTTHELEAPDISRNSVASIEEKYRDAVAGKGSEDVFIDVMSSLVFDGVESVTIKEQLLSLQNPLLSELVSTIQDPKEVDSWKRKIPNLVREAIQKSLNPDEVRESLNSGMVAMDNKLKLKLSTGGVIQKNDSGTVVADAYFNGIRAILRMWVVSRLKIDENGRIVKAPEGNDPLDVLMINLREKSRDKKQTIDIYNDYERAAMALDELDRFDKIWNQVSRIIVSPEHGASIMNKIFTNYLLKNPGYSGLWGYGVISFSLEDKKKEIADWLAMRMIQSERGKRRIEWVREVVANPAYAKHFQDKYTDPEFGIIDLATGDIETIKELSIRLKGSNSRSQTDFEIAKKYIATKGAYPEDGLYYYLMIGMPETMREKFETYAYSKPVLELVDKYLYHLPLSKGKYIGAHPVVIASKRLTSGK